MTTNPIVMRPSFRSYTTVTSPGNWDLVPNIFFGLFFCRVFVDCPTSKALGNASESESVDVRIYQTSQTVDLD